MRIARKRNPGKIYYHMIGNVLQEVEDNKYSESLFKQP